MNLNKKIDLIHAVTGLRRTIRTSRYKQKNKIIFKLRNILRV